MDWISPFGIWAWPLSPVSHLFLLGASHQCWCCTGCPVLGGWELHGPALPLQAALLYQALPFSALSTYKMEKINSCCPVSIAWWRLEGVQILCCAGVDCAGVLAKYEMASLSQLQKCIKLANFHITWFWFNLLFLFGFLFKTNCFCLLNSQVLQLACILCKCDCERHSLFNIYCQIVSV